MLTVDDIVEEYRSLGSETTYAANLRRYGFSAAAIKKAIANRCKHVGTESQCEQRIECFRQEIIGLSRVEQIGRNLSLFGSHERASQLWASTAFEPPEVFWPVVLDGWNTCDGMLDLRTIMLDTFRRRAAQLSPIMFMDADDRAFFDGLREPVTVFRGCGKRHVRGMAWTTDRKIAEFFARGGRFPQPRDPVIATAEIEKSAVFFVTQSRNESEVVLDPYRVKRLRLEPFAQSEAA